jgi:hypothetical protein
MTDTPQGSRAVLGFGPRALNRVIEGYDFRMICLSTFQNSVAHSSFGPSDKENILSMELGEELNNPKVKGIQLVFEVEYVFRGLCRTHRSHCCSKIASKNLAGRYRLANAEVVRFTARNPKG